MAIPRIAIIGAGVAGLAAAWQLRQAPVKITIYDKSKGVSGRAATRTRHGARFDFGANYFKLDNPELEQLVQHHLPNDGLVRIENDVWTFDASGRIEPGDPVQNSQARWTYRDGISTLGKRLASEAGAELRQSVRVEALRRREGRWLLQAENTASSSEEVYDAVLLTPPGPQVRDILAASDLGEVDGQKLDRAMADARYHQQLCFALGFREPLENRPPCFALINTDRGHDIAWLSFENDKPGRDLGGSSVIMLQMSPAWSERHFDRSTDELATEVTRSALTLLSANYRQADWMDCQRWRFAHPYQPADATRLSSAQSSGLFFAGDALVGKGRVGESIETGFRAARQIASVLML